MKTVPLGGKKAAGRVALVDDRDYDLVAQYNWHVREDTRLGFLSGPYACTVVPVDGKQKALFMHDLIAGYPKPDHIDGDGLNNCRSNLRPATPGQNVMNRRKRWRGSSRYVGVTLNRQTGKWTARIGHQHKVRNLGTFTSEEDAARAYDAAARELFGEYARLNFPETPDRHSATQNCLEVLSLGGGIIGLRNSRHATSPILRLTVGEWYAFVADVKDGAFEAPPAAA